MKANQNHDAPQSHAMLTPNRESELSWEEMGILSQMMNEPACDYVTFEQLARYSSDSSATVKKLLDALVKKDFVRIMDGIYYVNKYRIKEMNLTEYTSKSISNYTDTATNEGR